ncbi:hypothetical protein BJV82DRAFT_582741 [Fennellomyces sp. T-0311]|nr:hypothetical protein BJV82DRAFT_582741 [Fennellomyces sp. T-0311]
MLRKKALESRRYRLYIGNGNWVNLTQEATDDLNEIYKAGTATRYELAPGLFLDILPNDVDCNSKNTDLARLMRVDLYYENENEEQVQQRLSKYVKSLLEKQGTIDAFPPVKKPDDKLPRVTALPTHRHLSMVPTPPASVARRASTMSRRDDVEPSVPLAAEQSSPSSSNGKKESKKRKVKRRRNMQSSSSPSKEHDNGLDQAIPDHLPPTTADSALQYQYYAMGHHQQVILSTTPLFRPSATYYGEHKGMLLGSPHQRPGMCDWDSNNQQQEHDHGEPAENSSSFYGASNVLSHTDQYQMLSLSNPSQTWERAYRTGLSENDNENALVGGSGYEYYSQHQASDAKLHSSSSYDDLAVASALRQQNQPLQHQQPLSSPSSSQSVIMNTPSESYTGTGSEFLQTNYSNERLLHPPSHVQPDYEQRTTTYMVGSDGSQE